MQWTVSISIRQQNLETIRVFLRVIHTKFGYTYKVAEKPLQTLFLGTRNIFEMFSTTENNKAWHVAVYDKHL